MVVLIGVLASTPAQADYEETELRLKTAGVDDKLRARIHAAIGRGVGFLSKRQSKAGWWRSSASASSAKAGSTALCTLALRHAAIPASKGSFGKGMQFLFPESGTPDPSIHKSMYAAGITGMILMADNSHRAEGRRLGQEIARSFEPQSGWWGYSITPRYATSQDDAKLPRFREAWRNRNLSTTQFAALGMWAGDRLGAGVPKRVWRRHLTGLIRYQTQTGSWPYDPLNDRRNGAKRDPAGSSIDRRIGRRSKHWKTVMHDGRPACTFMGLANVLLAEGALEVEFKRHPALAGQARAVRLAAIDALDRDGPAVLDQLAKSGRAGYDTYYTLYALEKVCLFANRHDVGGRRWYTEVADWLCSAQTKGDGWHDPSARFKSSDAVTTAFALLVLLRASATYTPRDPRPIDSAAVTRRDGESEATSKSEEPLSDVSPPEPRVRIPLPVARTAMESLGAVLKDPKAANDAIIAALAEVDRCYRGEFFDPTTKNVEVPLAVGSVWRKSALDLALSALTLYRRNTRTRSNHRTAVNIAAARVLGSWNEEASGAIQRALESEVFDNRRFGVAVELYEAAFSALAGLKRPASARWLAREAIGLGRKPAQIARSHAALLALQDFRGLSGRVRKEIVEHLVAQFEKLVRGS